MLPHSLFILRQQACSAAVIWEPGNAQAMVGTRSDSKASNAVLMRATVCIHSLEYSDYPANAIWRAVYWRHYHLPECLHCLRTHLLRTRRLSWAKLRFCNDVFEKGEVFLSSFVPDSSSVTAQRLVFELLLDCRQSGKWISRDAQSRPSVPLPVILAQRHIGRVDYRLLYPGSSSEPTLQPG
jgi:hypothetical protein